MTFEAPLLFETIGAGEAVDVSRPVTFSGIGDEEDRLFASARCDEEDCCSPKEMGPVSLLDSELGFWSTSSGDGVCFSRIGIAKASWGSDLFLLNIPKKEKEGLLGVWGVGGAGESCSGGRPELTELSEARSLELAELSETAGIGVNARLGGFEACDETLSNSEYDMLPIGISLNDDFPSGVSTPIWEGHGEPRFL